MKVTVKTINGLHFLYCKDRSLRIGFWSHQKAWANTVAEKMSKGNSK